MLFKRVAVFRSKPRAPRFIMATETPRVESFVLRFVEDVPDTWHGVIVHVQTNEDQSFSDFADAVAFMARYVELGFVARREGDTPREAQDP
jgi:hypothetical protein